MYTVNTYTKYQNKQNHKTSYPSISVISSVRQGKAAFSSKSNSVLSVKCNYVLSVVFLVIFWAPHHPQTGSTFLPASEQLQSDTTSFLCHNWNSLNARSRNSSCTPSRKKVLHNEITWSSVAWQYYLLKLKKWQTLKSVSWSSLGLSAMLKLELHTGTCSICLMSTRHFIFSFFLILVFWHLSISFLLKPAMAT